MTTRAELIASRLTLIATRLDKYRAAETAILDGAQSYSIGSRTLSRADLAFIARQIKTLESDQLKLLTGGAIRVQKVVPRTI